VRGGDVLIIDGSDLRPPLSISQPFSNYHRPYHTVQRISETALDYRLLGTLLPQLLVSSNDITQYARARPVQCTDTMTSSKQNVRAVRSSLLQYRGLSQERRKEPRPESVQVSIGLGAIHRRHTWWHSDINILIPSELTTAPIAPHLWKKTLPFPFCSANPPLIWRSPKAFKHIAKSVDLPHAKR
jgi:hypothetical protein